MLNRYGAIKCWSIYPGKKKLLAVEKTYTKRTWTVCKTSMHYILNTKCDHSSWRIAHYSTGKVSLLMNDSSDSCFEVPIGAKVYITSEKIMFKSIHGYSAKEYTGRLHNLVPFHDIDIAAADINMNEEFAEQYWKDYEEEYHNQLQRDFENDIEKEFSGQITN